MRSVAVPFEVVLAALPITVRQTDRAPDTRRTGRTLQGGDSCTATPADASSRILHGNALSPRGHRAGVVPGPSRSPKKQRGHPVGRDLPRLMSAFDLYLRRIATWLRRSGGSPAIRRSTYTGGRRSSSKEVSPKRPSTGSCNPATTSSLPNRNAAFPGFDGRAVLPPTSYRPRPGRGADDDSVVALRPRRGLLGVPSRRWRWPGAGRPAIPPGGERRA